MTAPTPTVAPTATPLALDLVRIHQAGFGGIRIVTRDEEAFVSEVKSSLLSVAKGGLYSWSCASGLWMHKAAGLERELDERDPFVFFVMLLKPFMDDRKQPCTFLVFGLDEILEKEPVVRRGVIECIRYARTKGHLIVLVNSRDHAHRELHHECSMLHHELPSREQADAVLQRLMSRYSVTGSRELALDAAQGLTFSRQADAFSLALVDAKLATKAALAAGSGAPAAEIDARTVRVFKEKEVGKKAFLKIEEPRVRFSDLIGHDYLKQWLTERRVALGPAARAAGLPSPKGVLFVGPPGTGKSRLAEATALEWGVPYLVLDMGGLYGSLLGESEARLSEALEIAERMAPCLLLLDEVERGFGSGGADRDGGTQDRVLGKLLSWMASKTSPVFVVMTSNFADRLPAALIRKGRLDDLFCLDLPTPEERLQVFRHYLKRAEPHGLSEHDVLSVSTGTGGWVPSEIEAAVVSARFTAFAAGRQVQLFDIIGEIEKTVPVSRSMQGQVDQMRQWAAAFARKTHYETKKTETLMGEERTLLA